MRELPSLQKRIVRAAAVASGVIGVAVIGLAAPARAFAQTGGACIPVNERTTEYGCFVHAEQHLQKLPDGPVYWHIDRFADRSSAQAAKSANGTVVEILGTVWLFTIAGESWRPSAGEHIADVGPLTLPQASSLMATYMEGNFKPGMQSTIHRHPGTEAWFVLTGAQCLETPHGEQLGRPAGRAAGDRSAGRADAPHRHRQGTRPLAGAYPHGRDHAARLASRRLDAEAYVRTLEHGMMVASKGLASDRSGQRTQRKPMART
ncbi:hypothetical protein [Caballeronia sp. Sq4a]|uniref:hypothetical protein n=1 Tax=Caballeronia sp. Sq4a TaxID=2878152 RepID=UPI0020BE770A|nr:hypothetical protein [Caballeronia sp. Sq4a]